MFQPARAKRGQARGAEPPIPAPIALARHPTSPGSSRPQSFTPLAPRARSTSRIPHSHAGPSSETAQTTFPPDRHWHNSFRSRTPEPATRPTLLRRTLTAGSPPRDYRERPMQPVYPSRNEMVRESMDASLLPGPQLASPHHPSEQDPRRVLPLPIVSRVTSARRMSADDKALSALQTQFMK